MLHVWKRVNAVIGDVSGTHVPLTPRRMLLFDFEHGKTRSFRGLWASTLTAATREDGSG